MALSKGQNVPEFRGRFAFQCAIGGARMRTATAYDSTSGTITVDIGREHSSGAPNYD
jgi:hypothetical protein